MKKLFYKDFKLCFIIPKIMIAQNIQNNGRIIIVGRQRLG